MANLPGRVRPTCGPSPCRLPASDWRGRPLTATAGIAVWSATIWASAKTSILTRINCLYIIYKKWEEDGKKYGGSRKTRSGGESYIRLLTKYSLSFYLCISFSLLICFSLTFFSYSCVYTTRTHTYIAPCRTTSRPCRWWTNSRTTSWNWRSAKCVKQPSCWSSSGLSTGTARDLFHRPRPSSLSKTVSII